MGKAEATRRIHDAVSFLEPLEPPLPPAARSRWWSRAARRMRVSHTIADHCDGHRKPQPFARPWSVRPGQVRPPASPPPTRLRLGHLLSSAAGLCPSSPPLPPSPPHCPLGGYTVTHTHTYTVMLTLVLPALCHHWCCQWQLAAWGPLLDWAIHPTIQCPLRSRMRPSPHT